jgi:hypothetical protein
MGVDPIPPPGAPAPAKEDPMSQSVPTQHPAVVLRSHYQHLRVLVVIALIAVVGLTIAVVVLATDRTATTAESAAPVSQTAGGADGPRYVHPPGQGYQRVR